MMIIIIKLSIVQLTVFEPLKKTKSKIKETTMRDPNIAKDC